MLEVKTKDVYANMAHDSDQYDNSNYPKDHLFYCTSNKKVWMKIKDECAGLPITEFVGL